MRKMRKDRSMRPEDAYWPISADPGKVSMVKAFWISKTKRSIITSVKSRMQNGSVKKAA